MLVKIPMTTAKVGDFDAESMTMTNIREETFFGKVSRTSVKKMVDGTIFDVSTSLVDYEIPDEIIEAHAVKIEK